MGRTRERPLSAGTIADEASQTIFSLLSRSGPARHETIIYMTNISSQLGFLAVGTSARL